MTTAKASRELAERRVAELEGIERDLTADTEEVEALIATWRTWGETLACTQGAADGSIPAELQAQARQILKRLLVATILVKPNEPGDWSFGAYTRFEGLLMGGLNHGKVTLYQWEGEPRRLLPRPDAGGNPPGRQPVLAVATLIDSVRPRRGPRPHRQGRSRGGLAIQLGPQCSGAR